MLYPIDGHLPPRPRPETSQMAALFCSDAQRNRSLGGIESHNLSPSALPKKVAVEMRPITGNLQPWHTANGRKFAAARIPISICYKT